MANRKFDVEVLVKVRVEVDPAFGPETAGQMALAASSHNRNDTDMSSVMVDDGYGQSEILAQIIRKCEEVV